MNEYIKREALKENIRKRVNNSLIRAWFERIIDDISAEDAVEVKQGEWQIVYQNKRATVYECSVCNHLTFETSDYCICGARMKIEN